MNALLLVDIQNDFMPGGSLPVQNGNEIIPLINELMAYPFDLFVATKDWHPANHGSFATNHEGKEVGGHLNLGGLDQILWPAHCQQTTQGAEFVTGWDTTKINKIIYKGTDPLIDSYSTFYDNGHRKSTGLENYLRERGIKNIFIAGLATDYCVKYSALDALQFGFHPFVITDACRGVNLSSQDIEQSLDEMRLKGVTLIHSQDLTGLLQAKKRD